jgi:hypothetical protein
MTHRITAPIRPLVALLLFGGFLVVPEMTTPAAACAADPGSPYLRGFRGETNTPGVTVASDFYAAAEGSQTTVTIGVIPGHCNGLSGSAQYRTVQGSAEAASDYASVTGQTPELCDDVDGGDTRLAFCGGKPSEWPVDTSAASDSSGEPAVESLTFELFNGNPGLGDPSSAPIHVIDMDGDDRVSLEPTFTGSAVGYEKQEFGSIRIPVFWAGPGPPEAVDYTVEPDPAGPSATPTNDFTVATANPLPASAFDRRVAFIRLDIVGDTIVEPDEPVRISIQPDPAYSLAEPSSTVFTILDNEENIPPVGRFHHPRDGLRYRKDDYRIREFHTFFSDNPGGSGVVAAQMALRRKMDGGACGWWRGTRFRKGSCSGRIWKNMRFYAAADLFFYRMPALRPTVGTKVKNYRAWTRTIDAAGNVEKTFERGRNLSTFWIKRR